MINKLLNLKKGKKKPAPRRPVKETGAKTVPAERFNEMIDYYTAEIKSRIAQIEQLKQENEMLIKTSLRNAARTDEFRLHNQKLMDELRKLQEK